MKAVRLTRNLILMVALVMSLGANVTLFVGGVVYSFVDQFVEQAFGLATDAATQRKALAALKAGSAKQARALAASKAAVARQRGELSTLRAASARQRRAIGKLKAFSAKQRREIAALKAAGAKQARALSAARTASVRQGRKLAALRTANGKLASAFASLKSASARQGRELAALRTANGKLGSAFASLKSASARQGRELAALSTVSGKLRDQIGTIRSSVGPAAKRSRDRLVKSVARSVVTAPGKALPYAGVPIVVGLTVWEIRELCATIRDIDEIQNAARESRVEAESEPVDCSRPDLAAEHVLAEIRTTAQEAWDHSKRYIPVFPPVEALSDLLPDGWRSTWGIMKRLLP